MNLPARRWPFLGECLIALRSEIEALLTGGEGGSVPDKTTQLWEIWGGIATADDRFAL
jgi:hypothetical protein